MPAFQQQAARWHAGTLAFWHAVRARGSSSALCSGSIPELGVLPSRWNVPDTLAITEEGGAASPLSARCGSAGWAGSPSFHSNNITAGPRPQGELWSVSLGLVPGQTLIFPWAGKSATFSGDTSYSTLDLISFFLLSSLFWLHSPSESPSSRASLLACRSLQKHDFLRVSAGPHRPSGHPGRLLTLQHVTLPLDPPCLPQPPVLRQACGSISKAGFQSSHSYYKLVAAPSFALFCFMTLNSLGSLILSPVPLHYQTMREIYSGGSQHKNCNEKPRPGQTGALRTLSASSKPG